MLLPNLTDSHNSPGGWRNFAGALFLMMLLVLLLPLSKVRPPQRDADREWRPIQVYSQPALPQSLPDPAPSSVSHAALIPEWRGSDQVEIPFAVPEPPAAAPVENTSLKPHLGPVELPRFPRETDFDLNLFDVAELDFVPSLIRVPEFQFPAKLSRQGVHAGSVSLLVRVDAHGQVTVLEVLGASHDALIQEVIQSVLRARFQSPQKDGRPVAMQYYWTLELQDESESEGRIR